MRSKRMSLREAASLIPSGSSITLSGAILPRQPMAFIHELVRRGVTDLTVKLFVGSVGVDLLIGAGAVRRMETAYVGLGPFGLAPNFRRFAEAGRLEVEDMSESALMARFRAAGYGAPYLPTKALLGTSIVVTDKAVFDFEPESKKMRLRSVHPGVTREEVLAHMGFRPAMPDAVPETPPPTPEQVRLIRDVIDPRGILLGR